MVNKGIENRHNLLGTKILILHKSVLLNKAAVEKCRFLGCPLPLRVRHVNTMKTKLLGVAHGPLEVVHQGPGVVALHMDSITNSFQHLIDVMFVVVDPG